MDIYNIFERKQQNRLTLKVAIQEAEQEEFYPLQERQETTESPRRKQHTLQSWIGWASSRSSQSLQLSTQPP